MKNSGEKIQSEYDEEYKKLNKEQKDAVDTIDGPVMVVAGPGTGKTQILALRIGNILRQTDTKADSVLCLTFTNSAVKAMRERLVRYIGDAGEKVNIFTFHSFGLKMIEKYFEILGFPKMPKLLDESESAVFFDEILETEHWEYLRPRGDRTRYFQDLKSIMSLLKRERITNEEFRISIETEIKNLSEDEENISTRGKTKGELRQEVKKYIEGLEKSLEITKFFKVYETKKKEKNMLDYDDVLENLVRMVEISKEILADIREQYLYVLVDEHQDSSLVQNEFLTRTWSEVEEPNIFVVGDDRQLIYGFAGASIEHFKGFQKSFPSARLIPLIHNYRSTQIILDAAHALLPSVLSKEKLVSQNKEIHPIVLLESSTPNTEIYMAGEMIKKKIAEGVSPDQCALLVPKNAQVRTAFEIMHEIGLPLALEETLNLFDQKEAHAFLRILKILATGDISSLALSFFDDISGVPPLEAHKFLSGMNMRDFSLEKLLQMQDSLWGDNPAEVWVKKLGKWQKNATENNTKDLVEIISREIMSTNDSTKRLVSIEDIAITILSLLEKRPEATLPTFVAYLEKIVEYGDPIKLLTGQKNGVHVLTLHGSKGLEFDFVWIAHLDERSLTGGRRLNLLLPEKILERIEERDIDAVKRKLFVAITRAKRFCTLSYASFSHKGREQELAKIIISLPEEVFTKPARDAFNIADTGAGKIKGDLSELTKLVSEKYKERYISASMLNNFFECPWKWYFLNLLSIPQPENEHFVFGNAVHAALEQILKLNKVILPPDEEVAGVVKIWTERRMAEIIANRETEYPLSFADRKFPYLKIYGRIDLIEKLSDGSVRVTDFKTGGVRKKSEIEKIDEDGRLSGNLRQLTMYAYLLSQNSKWQAKVSSSRLEFVEAKNMIDMFYETIITPEQIELLVKDITDYDEALKTGDWINRECHYNSYGKNTECEYCELAEVYKSRKN